MGFQWFERGLLGVDIFFVISGFLIGGILLSELEKTGSLNFRHFYERRLRRIVAPLLMMMLMTFAASWFIVSPAEFVSVSKSAVFANFSLSNYFFLGSISYFDPSTANLPLIHTWSLAIEEQFYLALPLLLWLVSRTRLKRFIPGILIAIFVASAVFRAVSLPSNPDGVFYLIEFRAWELLGGVLAFILAKRSKLGERSRSFLSSSGLLAIVLAYTFDLSKLAPAISNELVAVLGTALIVAFSSQGTVIGKFLAWRPFVWIGLISYSLYLWHQPVFSLARISSPENLSPESLFVWVPLILGLAYVSWRFIENRFRDRKLMSTKRVIQWVTVLSAVLLIAASVVTKPASSFASYRVTATSTVTASELESRLSPNYGVNRVCTSFLTHKSKCTTGDVAGKPTVALWGDSFSMHLAQGLVSSPTKAKFIAQTLITCNPVYGLAPKNKANGMSGARNCIRTNTAFFNYLMSSEARSSIRTVILASHWENITTPGKTTLDSKGVLSTDSTKPRIAIRNTIASLKSAGYRVVVFASPAYTGVDLGACLKRAILKGGKLSACNFPLAQNQSTKPNELLTGIVTNADKLVQLVPLMCPKGTCLASAGSTLIYRDKYHISREGSAYLGKKYDLMGLALR
jgi:peptidoglycan/LPS O-acetylase OafA/YrhL